MPAISYIVSSHDRPYQLISLLCDLMVQINQDFEVLVGDNSSAADLREYHREIVRSLDDRRFHYYSYADDYPEVGGDGPYMTANWAAQKSTGEFLAFPSEDDYYSPRFGELMLKAALNNRWDLVICDCVYDCEAWRKSGQHPMGFPQNPIPGGIDKAGFIIRRSCFPGFPEGNEGSGLDGALIEKLVREGIHWGKVPTILFWHN